MRGVALIIVLLVVAIMTVSIVEFSYSTRVDLHLAGNMRDDAQVSSLAKAGLELAKGILIQDFQQPAAAIYYIPGSDIDYTRQFWSQACKFPPIPMELDQRLTGEIRGVVTDEGGKIPLNLLVDPKKGPPDDVNLKLDAVLKRLFVIRGVDGNLVDALEDWIDPDSMPRTYGAEGRPSCAGCPDSLPKNAPLTTITELRMVTGMTEKDREEMSPYQRVMERVPHRGDEDRGLCTLDSMDSPYLTVYPREFTTTVTINVNTAPLEVIRALFDLEEADADEIIRIRESKVQEGHPEATLGAIAPPNSPISPKVWNEVYPLVSVTSSYFSIRSIARIPNPAAGEEENAQQLLALKGLKAVVKVTPQASSRLEMLYYRED